MYVMHHKVSFLQYFKCKLCRRSKRSLPCSQENVPNARTFDENYLNRLLHWIGIISDSDDESLQRRCSFRIFQVLIIFTIGNHFVGLMFDIAHVVQLKLEIIFLASIILSSLAWYTIRRNRKQLSLLLISFEKVQFKTYSKINNILLLYHLTFLFTFTFEGASYASSSRLFLYGLQVESIFLKIILFTLKAFIYYAVYPTFVSLVMLLYFSLCYRCCQGLNSLTEEIQSCTPEYFTVTKQLDILGREQYIEDALNQLQNVFSIPSFFAFAAHFCSCSGILGLVLIGALPFMPVGTTIQISLYFVNSLCYIIACSWFVGGVSISMEKFKLEFSQKAQRRMCVLRTTQEWRFDRDLYQRPSLVLSGCDILYFTRNSILAVAGTLLTYTILILNYKDWMFRKLYVCNFFPSYCKLNKPVYNTLIFLTYFREIYLMTTMPTQTKPTLTEVPAWRDDVCLWTLVACRRCMLVDVPEDVCL